MSLGLACAIVATASPKVKAIWMTLEEPSQGVILLQPTKTRKNVPKNSADNMRHMLRLSVMSWRPSTAFAPAERHTDLTGLLNGFAFIDILIFLSEIK
jgi:hypothetical protein